MWLLIYSRRKINCFRYGKRSNPKPLESQFANKTVGELNIKDHIQYFFHTSSDPGLLKLNALNKQME